MRVPSGPPGCPLVSRRVADLLRRTAVGGPSGAVYSEWRDPGAFGCDVGTRACAFGGGCSVGRCASFRSLIGQPGYGARCGGTACPARAGACRHFLEVPQDYGHPVRFAKMIRLRRPTGVAGAARPVSFLQEREIIRTRAAKTPGSDLLAVVHASTARPDKVLCRPTDVIASSSERIFTHAAPSTET